MYKYIKTIRKLGSKNHNNDHENNKKINEKYTNINYITILNMHQNIEMYFPYNMISMARLFIH